MTIDHGRRRLLRATAAAIAGTRLGMIGSMLEQVGCATRKLPVEGELSSLERATAWVNTPALTATSLRGKVVLVDFWTYTCINWLRTLPYVRAWAEKYAAHGLAVIGVHSPEFDFERDGDNVRRAVRALRVDYPVAIDSDHEIWNGFQNEYWPALYLADAEGRIRYHAFGEGEYAKSERSIQRMLADAGARDVPSGLVSEYGDGLETPADWGTLRSAETYVGYGRGENFASPGGALYDERRSYSAPARLGLNQWALEGEWTVGRQGAVANAPRCRIVYRFHARDLHLVMGPAAGAQAVRYRVTVDGLPPGSAHGLDVDEHGNGVLREPRLHQLVRQRGAVDDRTFSIEFLDAGGEAFCFTFG